MSIKVFVNTIKYSITRSNNLPNIGKGETEGNNYLSNQLCIISLIKEYNIWFLPNKRKSTSDVRHQRNQGTIFIDY